MLLKSYIRALTSLESVDARAVVDELRELGLTGYEAKCYVSLARIGPSDPRKVAEDADIPPPNAYESLRRLAGLGWVDLVRKRPATYKAKRPVTVKSMMVSKMADTFDSLEKVYNAEPAQEAELVYTTRGKDKVLAKLYEMIRLSKRSIMLVAPTMSLDDVTLLDAVHKAIRRKVRVRMIGDEGALDMLPTGVELRMSKLVAVDALSDDTLALIALPDYSACGWIDSPQVAQHFKQFLELMWSNSRPAGRR
jgi:sugar-specific transcriptional regulator TrmB